MRTLWLTLLAVCLVADLSGATIGFTVGDLGGGSFQYVYSITPQGETILANDTLDISFDPAVYSVLSNGVGLPATDWQVMLLQPNVPFPGAFGDYLLTALVDNPSLAGPFTVDFTLQPGAQPGPQTFTLYDPNFNAITSGTTVPDTPVNGVPEPATALGVAGAAMACFVWHARRRVQS